MFVRRTLTRKSDTGEHYYSHRLVRSERTGGRVRQVTLLNLGSELALPPHLWPELCARIDEILHGHVSPSPDLLESGLEREAQRVAALLLARQGESRPARQAADGTARPHDAQSLDLDLVRVRTVGVEQVALWALGELRLAETLQSLGFPKRQVHAALGMIVAQMVAPGTEAATRLWWEQRSALGELLGVDLATISPLVLYRAGDNLLKHRKEIERQVLGRLRELLGLPVTEPVFDISHLCGEPYAGISPPNRSGALRQGVGRWPPVTLGLAVDGSGFVHRSASFVGDRTGGPTLQTMLDGLGVPVGSLAVMADGAASTANLAWLRANGYGYLLISRQAAHVLDPDHTVPELAVASSVRKISSADGTEAILFYDSPERSEKDAALAGRRIAALEAGLRRLAESISKPGSERRLDRLRERIRRLCERGGKCAQDYRIELQTDEEGEEATSLSWERLPIPAGRSPLFGTLCLRSSATDWDAERMWSTFASLADLDTVLASLKPGPDLRPFERPGEECSQAYLFVSVLAYQCIQLVRRCLKLKGIDASWQALRQTLAARCRVTVSVRREDGQTVHLRTTSQAEPAQLAIYRALGIDPDPGSVRTTVV